MTSTKKESKPATCSVSVTPGTADVGFDKTVETALIEVWPTGRLEKPTLDFMPPGCLYEDIDGALWEITRSIQKQHYNRYADETGDYEFTYSWEYHAIRSTQ